MPNKVMLRALKHALQERSLFRVDGENGGLKLFCEQLPNISADYSVSDLTMLCEVYACKLWEALWIEGIEISPEGWRIFVSLDGKRREQLQFSLQVWLGRELAKRIFPSAF